MAKKSEEQKRIERAMDTLSFEILEFIAHVPMSAPYGEYVDRFPLFRPKPADVEQAASLLLAEGLAERREDGGLAITVKGKQYRRLEDPAAVAFFNDASGPVRRGTR